METLVPCVLILKENTMPKECVIIVITHREELNKPRFASTLIEWHMLEECAIVATRHKNGRNNVKLKSLQNLRIRSDFFFRVVNDNLI
jgi:hypothetical protein